MMSPWYIQPFVGVYIINGQSSLDNSCHQTVTHYILRGHYIIILITHFQGIMKWVSSVNHDHLVVLCIFENNCSVFEEISEIIRHSALNRERWETWLESIRIEINTLNAWYKVNKWTNKTVQQQYIYDVVKGKLASPEFIVRSLYHQNLQDATVRSIK